jgi:uncharacterized membrane protein (UPF0136 family)
MTSSTDNSQFLRKAFRANAIFSAISGIVFVVANGLVAAILNAYEAIGLIQIVGANLLAFSVALFFLASREEIARPLTLAVIAADGVWVLGSWLAVAAGLTSGGGMWAVLTVADIVLLFAILQWLGLRKMMAVSAAA